ncbi:hypothetical protein [Streptomyces albipurpureus]|uniref:Uncharacterized protein n=1 Tax=Streptomyces albipurpureus TaxID=2897419 RepID=A0ABT0UNA5_9ACTN|nr:hypothetical protein [Streptomyces sp. CWNU-1]MCM2390082.1 hypothetical protein [Streptomyces sp. CWNU-1]
MSGPGNHAPGSDAQGSQRRVCGVRAVLPLGLVALVLESTPTAGDPLDVETSLSCPLEEHATGWHYDLVWELDDPGNGEMWALWSDGGEPELVVIQPDCPVRNGRSGVEGEACTLFAWHSGGHSFEFIDPHHDEVLLSAVCAGLKAAVAKRLARSIHAPGERRAAQSREPL